MIREAKNEDLAALAGLAASLWPHHAPDELAREFSGMLTDGDVRFFLQCEGDVPVGFAQCQLRRDYVEGAQTSPVGYLEGIFVRPDCRRRGYATALLAACETWARERGCTEFASDCELNNGDSIAFHRAMRFAQANRIVCFVKRL